MDQTNSPEPTLADVLKAVQALTERVEAQQKTIDLLSNPPSLEDIAQMDEKQLAELGLTPEDVQNALAELQPDQNGEPSDADGSDPAAANDGAGDAAAVAAPAGASLQALEKRITELSAKLEAKEKQAVKDEEATLFAEINQKVEALVAENTALRETIAAGGKPLTPSVDRNGVRFFSQKKDEGRFEQLVQLGIEEKKLSKTLAFEAARKEDPAAYQDYLVRLGVIRVE